MDLTFDPLTFVIGISVTAAFAYLMLRLYGRNHAVIEIIAGIFFTVVLSFNGHETVTISAIFIVGIVLGGLLLYHEQQRLRRERTMVDWHPVKAQVYSSEIQIFKSESFSFPFTDYYWYHPKILFRYIVEGKDYLEEDFKRKEQRAYYLKFRADKVLKEYPRQKNVTLYFNPENPHEITENPKRRSMISCMLVIAVGTILIFSSLLLIEILIILGLI